MYNNVALTKPVLLPDEMLDQVTGGCSVFITPNGQYVAPNGGTAPPEQGFSVVISNSPLAPGVCPG
jgi:hypothetical protein